MKQLRFFIAVFCFSINSYAQRATEISYNNKKAELTISQVSDLTFEIILSPLDDNAKPIAIPASDILINYPRKLLWQGRQLKDGEIVKTPGKYRIQLHNAPLRVSIQNTDGKIIQEFSWPDEKTGATSFNTKQPVYGLGEGGRSDHLDRRGFLHPMRDGNASYELATHGAYIAAPLLIGLDGWSVFFHQPVHRGNMIDLRNGAGQFIPDSSAKQKPLKLLVTAWSAPGEVFSEYRKISGTTPMPPLWSLGYMQSHRTLSGPDEMFWVANNFRERNLPVDAVIYLGTGFTPTGWNDGHNSFDFNKRIFTNPDSIIKGLKDLNYKVVLHNYSPPRNLYGTLDRNNSSANSKSRESSKVLATNDSRDTGNINHFWGRHRAVNTMIDGWWPDGGEGLSAESRITRHKMYFEGPLADKPNTRPWSLHRTGYNGAHRYGGWIWSGDPSCTWKTLETHIGVGLNHSLSLSPFWGTDVAGFVPTNELTGELYIRWLQFAAFTSSFRGHGRTWHLRLPWGWNQGDIGPPESSIFDSENRDSINKNGYPFPGELRNALIEPIARQYLNLRYQLLPYNYSLTRETNETGIPPMRAMWIHYPADDHVTNMSDQYMWGSSILVAPVYENGISSRRLYLPAGNWYDFWTNEKMDGSRFISRQLDLATMPLYVREGAIIPFDPVRQYTSEKLTGSTTLKVYGGSDGSFTLYEDDGATQDYLKGKFRKIKISWDDKQRRLTLETVQYTADEKTHPAKQPTSNNKTIQTKQETTTQNSSHLTPREFVIELLPEGIFRKLVYRDKVISITL